MSEMYLITIHNVSGVRVQMTVVDDTLGGPSGEYSSLRAKASTLGRAGAMFFGPDYTYKIWECKEMQSVFEEAESG